MLDTCREGASGFEVLGLLLAMILNLYKLDPHEV